ncbi:MAG: hypothetical protein JRJ85_22895, partial [Deltaproteobacteria bacterium]|nr:hypothetical protein [Deltaproteobacteria bacterium]
MKYFAILVVMVLIPFGEIAFGAENSPFELSRETILEAIQYGMTTDYDINQIGVFAQKSSFKKSQSFTADPPSEGRYFPRMGNQPGIITRSGDELDPERHVLGSHTRGQGDRRTVH